ncbi:MAG: AraC family transcriptional regulator [Puniceicoccaceae bacterium]|nr:MAG: AraC family transcriptional regulator [Puniceicoccaceae bacterium]
MIYLSYRPSPPLSLAVEAIWLYAGYSPPHRLERVLPSGTIEWVINLRADRFLCYHPETYEPVEATAGALVAGPRASVQIIDTEQQREIMGVHLRPGGMQILTGIPADAVAGRDVPLEELWGGRAAILRERLLGVPTPQEKIREVERWLAGDLRVERTPHRAVAEALRRLEADEAPVKLGDLAAELGLSSRRFIEVFTAGVGLTPKVYASIRRFQKALRTIHRTARCGWADLAIDCGWYDQAHMIRDFKRFSGLTPAEYARLQGDFMLHVPVEERGQICPIPKPEVMVGCRR